MRWGAWSLLLTTQFALLAQQKIGYIEFFGYQGMDVPAIRRALPFQEGDVFRPGMEDEARSAVERVTARKATDVSHVCCTSRGELAIFIGLPGASARPFKFEPASQGAVQLPADLTKLYEAMSLAETEATRRSLNEEDRPAGYRLLKEPVARASELAFRAYALGHEEEILNVLTLSGDAHQRAMAADALGFGAQTSRQIAALVRAARDPDEVVRNNATRALGEILRGDPTAASQISPDNFIDMLRSGTWADRNKGSLVLLSLTQSRDPILLRRIQSEAGDALLEMARWRPFGWALPARLIRARIDGKSDSYLWAYMNSAPLSLWQGAALAGFVSASLAFAFGRFPSRRANWAIALLASALISPAVYWVLLRFAGPSDLPSGGLALLFILPWHLAAAAAAATVILTRVWCARK
jgi:HEAT repeats